MSVKLQPLRLKFNMPKSKHSEKCEEKILNVDLKRSDEQKTASPENTGLLTPQILENSQTSDQQTPQPVEGAPTDKKRTDPKSSETVPPGNKLKTPENPLSQNNNNLTSQTSDQQTSQPVTGALTGSKRRKAYLPIKPIVPCPKHLQESFLPRRVYEAELLEKQRSKKKQKNKSKNKVSGLQQGSKAKLAKSNKARPPKFSKKSGVRERVSSGNKLKVQKNPPSKNNEQQQTSSVVKKQVGTELRNKKSANGEC